MTTFIAIFCGIVLILLSNGVIAYLGRNDNKMMDKKSHSYLYNYMRNRTIVENYNYIQNALHSDLLVLSNKAN
jgi:hypothetical protein